MGWRRAFFLVTLLLAPCESVAAPTSYVWPLKAEPVLTSSFGEPRSTHVHAGIDLSTGGRTGVACRAVADGSVVRMRMSPFGYGKVLYVQVDGGPLVVYAHLSRFAEPMAQRAWEEQVKRGQYTFDLHLPPGAMPVRQGEIVAWSGDTGVGWPHLHFEVRDGDVALNPQTAGFALRDHVAPVIQAVEIVPLDPEAHVEGRLDPWISQAPSENRPVRVGGRVGFAVRCIDRAGPGSYRQVPYRYVIRIDGRPLYRAEHERFDYAVNHHIVLDYDQEQLQEQDARFFWLYARAANGLPGREAAASGRGTVIAGIAEARGLEDPSFLPPGRHEVEIEVADVAGQRQTVRFFLWASQKPRIESFRASGGGAQQESLVVQCRARDADGDSLTARFAFSTDGGTTWVPFEPEPVPSSLGVPQWTWEARRAWPAPQPVALRVEVEDPAGLRALAVSSTGTEPTAEPPRFEITRRWRHGRLEIEAEASTLLGDAPTLSLFGKHGSQGSFARPVQTTERRYGWALDVEDLEDFEEIVVSGKSWNGASGETRIAEPARLVRRGRGRHIDDLHPAVRLDFDKDTLFESIVLRLEDVDPRKLRPGPELEPQGPCVRLEPRTAALDGRLVLRVRLPETLAAAAAGEGKPGLFMVDGSGRLSFLGAERNGDGELVAETRRLGTFVVLRDTKPPVLRDFRAVPRQGDLPRLQFAVSDGGADLSDRGIRTRIDGTLAIPEWDPETGRVVVHPTERLDPGLHHLQVEAEDRLGNRSEQTWEFTLP